LYFHILSCVRLIGFDCESLNFDVLVGEILALGVYIFIL